MRFFIQICAKNPDDSVAQLLFSRLLIAVSRIDLSQESREAAQGARGVLLESWAIYREGINGFCNRPLQRKGGLVPHCNLCLLASWSHIARVCQVLFAVCGQIPFMLFEETDICCNHWKIDSTLIRLEDKPNQSLMIFSLHYFFLLQKWKFSSTNQ